MILLFTASVHTRPLNNRSICMATPKRCDGTSYFNQIRIRIYKLTEKFVW